MKLPCPGSESSSHRYHSIGHRHTCKQQDTYDIQGRLGAHKWLMVPLYFAKDHDSLTHLENNFIRRFGTLNKRVTAKKYKKRFPHKRTINRRQRADKNKPMVMPAIGNPVTTWHSKDMESTTGNPDKVMQQIDASKLPYTIKNHKGLIEDTNFNSIFRKYSRWTIQLFGGGNTTVLKDVLPTLKRGAHFTVVALNHKTQRKNVLDKLIYLGMHPHAYKRMRQILTDSEIEQCYNALRLVRNGKIRADAKRSMQWVIKHRFKGFRFEPFLLRVPYGQELDKKRVAKYLHDFVRTTLAKYPTWLQDIHINKCRVITLKNKSIGDLLINMRQRAILLGKTQPVCMCQRLREKFPHVGFPTIDGHIFFTGEEFDGHHRSVMVDCKPSSSSVVRARAGGGWEKGVNEK